MASGLFLSRNSGENFDRVVDGVEVIGVTFDLDRKSLWFSSYFGKAALTGIALAHEAKAEALLLPALKENAVVYIAQNPVRRNEMAIASFKRNVFFSKDLGRNWKRIAHSGETYE